MVLGDAVVRHRHRHIFSGVLLAASLLASTPVSVAAQEPPTVPREILNEVWNRVSGQSAAALAAATTPEARQTLYEEMFQRLITDPAIARLRDVASYQEALERLAAEVPDATLAKSVNGTISNPVAGNLVERSGFTDLIALAGDFKELFSSNNSAVSVNLNALALFNSGRNGAYSAPFRYRQHELLKRIGGTVTFGAKIPEGEITGFTGLPNADQLLDVFVWDVKVRVVGDRDPRAARWYPLLLGEMGDNVELAARLTALPSIPDQDAVIVARAANRVLGSRLTDARRTIGSSLQASVKASGKHLTREAGKTQYIFAGMLDEGMGGVDLTLNLSYRVMDEMQAGANDPFRVREWQIGGGLTGSVLRDVVAAGRSAELSANFTGQLPMDDGAAPVVRKNIWKAGLSLVLPFQKSAKIPISVTYSNDPNNLTKEKYVTGHIGVSYDFGALLRPLGGSSPGK